MSTKKGKAFDLGVMVSPDMLKYVYGELEADNRAIVRTIAMLQSKSLENSQRMEKIARDIKEVNPDD